MLDGPMRLAGVPNVVAVSMMTSMMLGADEPSASSSRFATVAFQTYTVTCTTQLFTAVVGAGTQKKRSKVCIR